MKFYFLIPNLGQGGAQRVIVTICNFLAKNYEVTLVVLNGQKKFIKVEDSVNLVDLRARNFLFAGWSLVKFFRRENPQIVLSTTELCNVLICALKPLLPRDTRILLRISNTVSELYKNDKRLLTFIIRYLAPWVYTVSHKIICVSQGVMQDLASLNGRLISKLTVVYNPIIDSRFFEQMKVKPLHSWYTEFKVIVAVGRLWKQKDYPTLLKAFKKVADSRVDVRLIIVGDGNEKENLIEFSKELKVEHLIDLIGYDENPFSHMYHSEVYVLPSLYEGLPAVLIQALACRANIVSTDCKSGPREILREGKYGRLVQIQDSEIMAQSIIEALDLPLELDGVDVWLDQFRVENSLELYQEKLIESYEY